VVGSKQLSSFAALVLGAVSRTAVEHAACSVAVVPASR
jgi:nucleotide-binding universal stress UspA family protein